MSTNTDKKTVSEEQLLQRQEASKTHGAFAVRDRGKAALQGTGRSRLQDIEDGLVERSSAIVLLREHTAKSLMICELALGFVVEQRSKGRELDGIPVFKALPAFFNTAQRALRDMINFLPDDTGIIDEAAILVDLKKRAEERGNGEATG